MGYTGIGFSFLLDYYVFDLSFTALEITGVFICLFFSFLASIYKHFRSKAEAIAAQEAALLKSAVISN